MKRHITELEQRLIDNGFCLSHKTYKGKDRKRTEFYVYVGQIDDYSIMVFLDYKRENIDHYTIENTLPQHIYKENIDKLCEVYDYIFNILYSHNVYGDSNE